MDFDSINEYTGFANGDLFENEQEILSYFTLESMANMFGEIEFDEEKLVEMTNLVIENKWHMR